MYKALIDVQQREKKGKSNSLSAMIRSLLWNALESRGYILRSDYKIKGLNEKDIPKRMMKGKIPETIVKRSKQAYRAPVNKIFLGNNESASKYRQFLSQATISETGIFDENWVSKLGQKFDKQQRTKESS